jgi:predicted AAA+ superfamily ATPase
MERYNPWWTDEPDFVFERWKKAPIRWVPQIAKEMTFKPFSLHFLSGPRQVGKTTAIKLIINELAKKRNRKSIFYYSCDELTDHRELGEVLDNYTGVRRAWGINGSIIFLDEITFVSDWWRSIKSRIDSGEFKKDVLVITGSARIELLRHKETFPGRRGFGKDFILHPLSFSEYAKVRHGPEIRSGTLSKIDTNAKANGVFSKKLSSLFSEYLISGGFPLSIRDFSIYRKVSMETERTYLDWLRGDWSKVGRSDRFMKEVLSYLFRAKGTPVSWNSISKQTSINSPNTVRTYIETLEGIQSIMVLNYMGADNKVDYKKNKKIHFTDPFIYRILGNYSNQDVSEEWVYEATVASHISRRYPVYYWRNHTEVDVVCMHKNKQVGFEITKGLKKWKPPWHLKKSYLLAKDNIHLYLSALN